MQPPRDDGDATVEAPEAPQCDACGVPVRGRTDADAADDGYDVPGRGVYVWTRGEEVRFEKVPLCSDCASAIGVTALSRWEIEEEEG